MTNSVTMKVPKGVKSGQSLKLRGKGWTLPKGGRGDLFAKLQIVTPQKLNEIEQECYEKIQANTSFNPRSQLEEMTLEGDSTAVTKAPSYLQHLTL